MNLLSTPEVRSKGPALLHIDSSAKTSGSISRLLTDEFVAALDARLSGLSIATRNLDPHFPHIDEAWVAANNTAEDERSEEQKKVLSTSDALIAELDTADILLVGIPLYNFSIPSTLKAWIDHICRIRKTFAYGENGPQGLLANKQAVLVFATGGTAIGSEIDFASAYMRHILGFIGITDIHVIAADRLFADLDAALATARNQCRDAVTLIANRATENQV